MSIIRTDYQTPYSQMGQQIGGGLASAGATMGSAIARAPEEARKAEKEEFDLEKMRSNKQYALSKMKLAGDFLENIKGNVKADVYDVWKTGLNEAMKSPLSEESQETVKAFVKNYGTLYGIPGVIDGSFEKLKKINPDFADYAQNSVFSFSKENANKIFDSGFGTEISKQIDSTASGLRKGWVIEAINEYRELSDKGTPNVKTGKPLDGTSNGAYGYILENVPDSFKGTLNDAEIKDWVDSEFESKKDIRSANALAGKVEAQKTAAAASMIKAKTGALKNDQNSSPILLAEKAKSKTDEAISKIIGQDVSLLKSPDAQILLQQKVSETTGTVKGQLAGLQFDQQAAAKTIEILNESDDPMSYEQAKRIAADLLDNKADKPETIKFKQKMEARSAGGIGRTGAAVPEPAAPAQPQKPKQDRLGLFD